MKKNYPINYDAIIVGAGLVGMSMALALARNGLNIATIEKNNIDAQLEPEFDGRVSAISLGSQRILDNIGAWEFMIPHAEPILDIRVTDGATPFFLHFDHQEISNNPFGYIVENRYIRHALHKAAAQLKNLTLIDNFIINNLTQDSNSATVTGDNNKSLCAKLLIAADGKSSQMREFIGIKATSWDYRQTAIVCTIKHELPHHGLAQERFLPIGPFAVLPMTGNRSSLVWVEPNDRVKLYMELPEEEFVQEIIERTGDYLGKINTIGNRFSYPLSLLHAKKYTSQRVALIGDAAHGIHPIAGQGVNLGFRDVDALAGLISKQHSLGLDIGNETLLANYAHIRSFDNVSMLAIT
ncbi:MAG: UbiH/UbiF/VisC/COQ6 family ubiquinone biosynthesis hydroxylase, partial [Rickettsiales bacterium]